MSKHTVGFRRAVLDRIRAAVPNQAGPFAEGLRHCDQLVIASFISPYVCRHFRQALSAAGIRSSQRRIGGMTSVSVGFGDRETAREVLARHQIEFPDQRPKGTRGAFDFTILGGVAGVLLGVVSLAFSPQTFVRAITWIGFLVTGSLVGYVADRLQRSYRYLGKLRFEVTDCFLIITLAGLVLAFWTYLLRLV
jgi:hypothetical protein